MTSSLLFQPSEIQWELPVYFLHTLVNTDKIFRYYFIEKNMRYYCFAHICRMTHNTKLAPYLLVA